MNESPKSKLKVSASDDADVSLNVSHSTAMHILASLEAMIITLNYAKKSVAERSWPMNPVMLAHNNLSASFFEDQRQIYIAIDQNLRSQLNNHFESKESAEDEKEVQS